jgi:hypothetical protein
MVVLELLLGHDTSLLLEHLEFLFLLIAIFLESRKGVLYLKQFNVHFLDILLLLLVLLCDILVFFASVTQNNNRGHNLLSKLMKLIVTLLNLIIESLVFNF